MLYNNFNLLRLLAALQVGYLHTAEHYVHLCFHTDL